MDNPKDTKDTPPPEHEESSSLESKDPPAESPAAASPADASDSLETPDDGNVQAAPSEDGTKPADAGKQSFVGGKIKKLRSRVNRYLLMFIAVLVIAGAILLFTALSNNESTGPTIGNQTLSEDALKQLANTDATVGDPKQILNVQSNAVFAGKVLVRGNLDVAGQINVGGPLSLPGITVSGNSQFDQLQVNKSLSVAGDTAIQGKMTIGNNISVSGGGNFGGPVSAPQISTDSLQLSGDLNLTRHIIAGGVTPGRTTTSALGAGGTGSISGSDSGGSVNLNTGSSPSAGCLITINFAAKYNSTPHVVISPVGSAAAGLNYYVNRNTTSFSICTTNAPPAGASFGFDYFVTG